MIERAHQATPESAPLFRQLETKLKALSPREITERIKAHLESDWKRQSGRRWDEKKKTSTKTHRKTCK